MTVQALESRRLLSLTTVGPASNVPTFGTPLDFDVAVAGNGSSIVVNSVPNKGNLAIMANRYSAAGALIETKLVANLNDGGPVSVAMDADGDAVVAYLSRYTSDEILFQRVSRDGVWSDAIRAVTQPDFELIYSFFDVDVAMDESGGFFLSYVMSSGVSNHNVRFQVYDAAGERQGYDFLAYTHANVDSDLFGLDIDARDDGSGAVYTALVTHSDNFTTDVVFGQVTRTAPVGEPDRTAGLIGPAHSAHNPTGSIAVRPDGTSIVAYDTEAGGTFLQRYAADATPLGEPIEVSDATKTAIAALIDNSYVVVAGNVATRFTAANTADPGVNVVFAGTGSSRIAAGSSGNIVLVYEAGVDLRQQRLATSFAVMVESRLVLSGTDGDDTIIVKRAADDVIVQIGTLAETFHAPLIDVLSIDGFDGDDTITNDTDIPSTLGGGDGHDTIFGGTGDDRLYGNEGNDSLWGRDGADRIFGDAGVDSIYGNGGNDRLDGGVNSDHIRGNAGRDRIYGGGGNDKLYGGPAGDWLYSGAGLDQLYGEGGNDRLYGDYGGGPNHLDGGAGDDILVSRDDALDNLFGGRGRDTALADQNDILTGVEVTS